jgi:hypothetical protein
MTSRAHLNHLMMEIRRLAAPQAVHGVELFHMLKIGQLMRRSEPILVLRGWQVLRWVGYEIEDRNSKPRLCVLRTEGRKAEIAMVLIVVLHS